MVILLQLKTDPEIVHPPSGQKGVKNTPVCRGILTVFLDFPVKTPGENPLIGSHWSNTRKPPILCHFGTTQPFAYCQRLNPTAKKSIFNDFDTRFWSVFDHFGHPVTMLLCSLTGSPTRGYPVGGDAGVGWVQTGHPWSYLSSGRCMH